jgi:hypothetical protein
VKADIDLIWGNCKTYNMVGSNIYNQAETLERLTSKLWKKTMSNLSGRDKSKEDDLDMDADIKGIPFEEKVKFAEDVRKLHNEGLT